jgi:threonine synthase
MLETIAAEIGIYVNSTTRHSNPYQSEAGKTIAYELHEQMAEVPDWLIVPTGGGGTIAAIWRGYEDLRALGWTNRLPRLLAVVPRDYNLIERAFAERVATDKDFKAMARHKADPTVLSKLAHVEPPDGFEALQAIRASDGWVVSVTDHEAFAGQRRIAETEGVYVEPSSGTIVQAIEALIASGRLAAGGSAVALLCGSGFRETFVSMKQRPWQARPARLANLPSVISQIISESAR